MAEQQTLPATHRALVQNVYAQSMIVEDVPTPAVVPGSAILRVESAGIISYQKEVYNGTRKYPYPTPIIPGLFAIGRVVAAGPDAVALEPGLLVFFDCFIRGRDNPAVALLSGLSDVGEAGARKLMSGEWRNSTYAQYAKVPLENCFPLDETRLCGSPTNGGLGYSFAKLTWIGMPVVGYGGLRRVRLQAGETVIIAPATGGFGGAATMAALAMGARVIAM
jgi:NADPH:quinone reductase-like Zn-dependent oxidoreductase